VKELQFIFLIRSFRKPHIGIIIGRKEDQSYKESVLKVFMMYCRSVG